MSRFRDQVKADSARLFRNPEEFGESIRYEQAGGKRFTIQALLDFGGVYQPGEVREQQIHTGFAFIGRDQTQSPGGGIKCPARGDVIVQADGTRWSVMAIEGHDDWNWELTIEWRKDEVIGNRGTEV